MHMQAQDKIIRADVVEHKLSKHKSSTAIQLLLNVSTLILAAH